MMVRSKSVLITSHGIIGMLEVIKTDFERTIMHTTASEVEAHKEFIEFERVSKTDISGKSKKEELDTQDLKTTLATIVEKMSALTTAQGLLDAALKRLTHVNRLRPVLLRPRGEARGGDPCPEEGDLRAGAG